MSSRALVADAQSSPASDEARRLAHIRALKTAETRSVLEEGDYWGWLLARLRLTSHKVLLTVIPLVLLTVLVRVLLQVLTRGEFSSSPDAAGFQGIFAAETVTPFTTASMFVIALMLSGVMEDYKESEKIPAEIACALDSLSSKACYVEHAVAAKLHELREEREEEEAHARKHGERAPAAADGAAGGRYFRRQLRELDNLEQFDGAQVHSELARYTECLMEYFAKTRNYQDIMAITSALQQWLCVKFRSAEEVSSVEIDGVTETFDELRGSLARMSVIKRTNFIPSGYHLMSVLVLFTVFLVTLARYDNGAPEVPAGGGGRRLGALGEDDGGGALEGVDTWISKQLAPYINIATYNFLFIYILFLLNDLEDPFEYSLLSLIPQGNKEHGSGHELNPYVKGAADVDMYPIIECYARLVSHEASSAPGAMEGVRGSYHVRDARAPSQAVAEEDSRHSTEEEAQLRVTFREALRLQLRHSLRSAVDTFAEKRKEEGGASSSPKAGSGGSGGGASSRSLGSLNGGAEERLLA